MDTTHGGHQDDLAKHGSPLHFPAGDTLAQTETNKETIVNARAATEKEHNMTLMQGIRLYPKAICWSLLISTCIAMEGFDLALVNNLYGFPQWNQKFGELTEIIGLFLNGWVSERFGYRYTVIACLTMIMGFTAIFFTANSVAQLLVAEILCGIPWYVCRARLCNYIGC
jgi:SP family general alpha glucoside:H+ symporter-like MFS transporter